MSATLPNVLWLFSDQHRPHAMSCYGDENIHTPHLDQLAAEGIRFVNAYSNTPLCTPFRASLYTGKYMTSHGAISLHVPPHQGQRMLAQELQQFGYHTSHMGKWHVSGGAAPCHFVSPYFRPGWHDWLGWESSNQPWATEYSEGTFPLPVRTLPKYQTDALTDLTINWLDQQPAGRPWFHVVSIEPPHPPYSAPDEYMEMFKDKQLKLRPNVPLDHPNIEKFKQDLRAYYAQIANLDENIGRIIQKLRDTGQLDNTIIFYFSDHGDMMGSHGMQGKSRPEVESSQIPLIIRYPERIAAGQVSEANISGVDFMPTLLGMLGADVPSYVDGTDLSKTIYGQSDTGTESVLLQYEKTFWDEQPEQTFRTLMKGEWFYTYYRVAGPSQLFHRTTDPYQLHNRIDDPGCSHIQEAMHAALIEKLNEIGDDFFGNQK